MTPSDDGVDYMRRASSRAIKILMQNMKKQNNRAWIPSGR